MKFSVSSSALLSLLATTGKVISNKNTLPILDYFLMELSGSVFLLLMTFPVVASSESSAELDTENFILFSFCLFLLCSLLFSYRVASLSSAMTIIFFTNGL